MKVTGKGQGHSSKQWEIPDSRSIKLQSAVWVRHSGGPPLAIPEVCPSEGPPFRNIIIIITLWLFIFVW